jgi:hypothetical protein
VALIVEVTRSIRDKALAEFQQRYPSQLLATVCLRPVAGPSPVAVTHPGQVSRAAEQFRGVLDTLHQHLEGAESVLLAMDCPASFAAALGSALNLNTQHPLRLHHFHSESQHYVPVYLLSASGSRSTTSATEPSGPQVLEATQVLGEVRKVHQELVAWLKESEQQELRRELDGQTLLRSEIDGTPATNPGPLFRHLGGRWSLHYSLLLSLGSLRKRVGSEDWKECVRLFLLHEVFHVQQGGLTSYNYSGSGRTGFVLESVDYDADAVAIQVALAWREAKQGGAVKDAGRTKTLEAIVWNVLEMLRVFEPERPLRDLSERRLRRYLIWLFHACRLAALTQDARAPAAELERVTIEVAGLQSFPDPHESYAQQRVRLEPGDEREPLELAVYFQRRLVRESKERAWVVELLQWLSRWEEHSREGLQDALRLHFERFFDRHRELVRS